MVTLAHNGDISYFKEASYGAGFPAVGQIEIPSDSVTSSTLEVRKNTKLHHTISQAGAVDTTHHQKIYVLTINYALQQMKAATQHLDDTCLAYYAQNRTAGDLDSLAFMFETNTAAYEIAGCKINTYSASMTEDNEIPITVEIWGQALTTEDVIADYAATYGAMTAASAIAEDIEIFEAASVTRSGSWTDGIQSMNFTINNNLGRIPKVGSAECVGVYPAHMALSGTADIIANLGGEVDVDELLDGDEVDIVAASGTTASKSYKWTFTNAAYTRTPVPYTADMSCMIIPADWGAEDLTFAAYS